MSCRRVRSASTLKAMGSLYGLRRVSVVRMHTRAPAAVPLMSPTPEEDITRPYLWILSPTRPVPAQCPGGAYQCRASGGEDDQPPACPR
jgi:hypothetical protein